MHPDPGARHVAASRPRFRSPASAVEDTCGFIVSQLERQPGAGLCDQRIVLLGSLPARRSAASRPARCGSQSGAALAGAAQRDAAQSGALQTGAVQSDAVQSDAAQLCARLLQRGGQLLVLDQPRSRLLIETLLPLAVDGRGRWRGSCRLESDLAAACRDAAALLLLPGWRPPRSLRWNALAGRMRPQALLFDLRPAQLFERPLSCGLRVWWLGASTSWA